MDEAILCQLAGMGKGVDGGAWEGMMVGRKLRIGVSDENNETIDSSISDNVDFYSDR